MLRDIFLVLYFNNYYLRQYIVARIEIIKEKYEQGVKNMISEYEKLKDILKELEYLDKAKKYALNLKVDNSYIENTKRGKFIGKKFNMLTMLETTDKRTKSRSYIV